MTLDLDNAPRWLHKILWRLPTIRFGRFVLLARVQRPWRPGEGPVVSLHLLEFDR